MNSHPLRSPGPQDSNAWLLVFAAWVIATTATLAVLFFGEVMNYPICTLCWYQRIFMMPLAVILPLGLFPFDPRVVRYALPLAVIGSLIAVFHQLLVMGIIPESIKPCTQGVPCSVTVVTWFGFLTIPLLSVLAFLTIAALLLAARYRSSR
ncbi:disulfide bond formation protein B [Dechloromonas sp. A34]|uniref:disulfide bond formation protein B n=1 Tax=Dechloromonas sp. A34 TaxID=447588 RepID=UPI002248C7E0|nr:disulfide bond formation protein B [Dechloromonas sp. A34]